MVILRAWCHNAPLYMREQVTLSYLDYSWFGKRLMALVQISVRDAVSMVPRGWDIGHTSPMGPFPWPSWIAQSHGDLHEGQPLYLSLIHI